AGVGVAALAVTRGPLARWLPRPSHLVTAAVLALATATAVGAAGVLQGWLPGQPATALGPQLLAVAAVLVTVLALAPQTRRRTLRAPAAEPPPDAEPVTETAVREPDAEPAAAPEGPGDVLPRPEPDPPAGP
ncbi:MAG: hypothetical protein JWO79_4410, partial [Actinomycetia bacterium]|nr:hypothetical protein [Actinomycetes bacterium]